MEFARVLREITEYLDSQSHRYALIGGHALAAYGLSRSTLDLDLVVDSGTDRARVRDYFEQHGLISEFKEVDEED